MVGRTATGDASWTRAARSESLELQSGSQQILVAYVKLDYKLARSSPFSVQALLLSLLLLPALYHALLLSAMPVQDDERTQLLPDQTNVFVLVHQVRKRIKVCPFSCFPPSCATPVAARFADDAVPLSLLLAGKHRYDPQLGPAQRTRCPVHHHPTARPPVLQAPKPGHRFAASLSILSPSLFLARLLKTLTLHPALLDTVYALLLNRLHFLRLAESDLSYSSLQYSRAGTLSSCPPVSSQPTRRR